MTSLDIQGYLNDHSTSAYFIEYGGFLSNHLSHGVIALHRLEAPKSRLERFAKWYIPKLEAPANDVPDNRPIEELLGARKAFYRIVDHYEELLKKKYNSNVDDLIKAEYPKIAAGLAGSALHGTIHLGYSYSVKNVKGILEGLAYTYHSFRPAITPKGLDTYGEFGAGSKDILTVLADIRNNTGLWDDLQVGRELEQWTALNIGRFQIGVCYLLDEHGDDLFKYAHSLHIDSSLRSPDSSIDPIKLARRLLYWVVLTYAKAVNPNDFFLLHGVTCAWGINQFISLLDKTDAINVLRSYVISVLAVYIVQGAPDLTSEIKGCDVTENDWKQLIERTMSEDRDEHCYKMVQVCRELAKDAEVNGEDKAVYYQAAVNSIEHEFVIRPPRI